MNTKALFAIAALAAAASTGVRADEADASQYVIAFEGSRTRAEVQAEAAQVAKTRSTEPAGSRVAAPIKSVVDAQSLRAQAAEAVRLGKISYGEAGGVWSSSRSDTETPRRGVFSLLRSAMSAANALGLKPPTTLARHSRQLCYFTLLPDPH